MAANGARLAGRRVLVLEDEYFIAQDLAEALSEAGAQVLGPFPNVAEARAALEQEPRPDIGVLDINLSGQMAFEIAAQMQALDIPFVFATGYEPASLPAALATVPVWRKPFVAAELVVALSALRA